MATSEDCPCEALVVWDATGTSGIDINASKLASNPVKALREIHDSLYALVASKMPPGDKTEFQLRCYIIENHVWEGDGVRLKENIKQAVEASKWAFMASTGQTKRGTFDSLVSSLMRRMKPKADHMKNEKRTCALVKIGFGTLNDMFEASPPCMVFRFSCYRHTRFQSTAWRP